MTLSKVYCETCCQMICCECTISKEHNKHDFCLKSEFLSKHHQQIQDSLDLLQQKMADIDMAITHLDTREGEVLQQGQQLKEQINTHAQKSIDKVKRSHARLSQQVDTTVQQKTQTLSTQRQQAQRLLTQLRTCQEKIEYSLKKLTQQIRVNKHTMMDEMNTTTQHVDPTVFQPIEKADMQFTKYVDPTVFQPIEKADMQFTKCETKKEIGLITSTTYGKATLTASPSRPNQQSTATLTLQSHDGSPCSLPPSLSHLIYALFYR